MTADRPDRPGDPDGPSEAARRRRLRQQVFGDVLPDVTADERDEPSAEGNGNDDWLRSNVPPHHG